MWWQMIPSGTIITLLLYAPQIAGWHVNLAVYGNGYRRDLTSVYARRMFNRDTRIDGAPWLVRGLENIPDED